MAEENLKMFTIRLYEGGLTSANQTAKIMHILAEDRMSAVAMAIASSAEGSIVTYCAADEEQQ